MVSSMALAVLSLDDSCLETGRVRLETIPQTEQESANDMFFAAPSSPLTTPKTVFNMMHNQTERDAVQAQAECMPLWAKP